MSEGESTASNFIWAIAFIIIVAIIAGTVYFSGVLRSGPTKHEVDIKVEAPVTK